MIGRENLHDDRPKCEPIVYGGYGSGANAVQVEYVPDCAPAPDMDGRGTPVQVPEMGRAFSSIRAAAQALGVSPSKLQRELRKHGRATVNGYEVEVMRR